jgi:hypothetical protein
MKVSLVFPPFHLESLYSLPPLGLINLGTSLRAAGHDPVIHDFVLDLREGTLPFGESLYEACAERVLADNPRLVGFSAQCTTYPAMIGVARAIKRRDPFVACVAGGHNASFVDRETLDHFPEFDAVVRGEGELAFTELVGALASDRPAWEVPGVTARRAGKIAQAPERDLMDRLDDLLLPDYTLAPPLARYKQAFNLERSIAILEVGRGCPHACAYCSESAMWRRRIRTFSVERLVAEMRRLRDGQGAECFLLSYDQFTADRDFVRRFCEGVLNEGLAGLGWYCISRLDTVDPELFALMRQAGCESMCYGIDSGSPRTLSFINKRIDETLLHQRVRETTEHGMNPTLSFIIGFPEEELADIDATLTLALKCGIQGNVSPLMQLPTVLPGTSLHRGYSGRLIREVDTYFAMGLEFLDGRRLAGDEALIRTDPALFSSFYNLSCAGVEVKKLAQVAASFPLIINFFPKAFHLLTLAREESPTLMFLSFLEYVRERENNPGSLTAVQCYRHFPSFAEKLLSEELRLDWPVLPEILRYEGMALKAAGIPVGSAPADPGRPARRGNTAVAHFDMDMETVVEDLKAGMVKKLYPASVCSIVFVHEGDRLEVTKLNLFGKDVLELCDGEHSLDEIVKELQPRHGVEMEESVFADHCRDAVKTFQLRGLVAAAA